MRRIVHEFVKKSVGHVKAYHAIGLAFLLITIVLSLLTRPISAQTTAEIIGDELGNALNAWEKANESAAAGEADIRAGRVAWHKARYEDDPAEAKLREVHFSNLDAKDFYYFGHRMAESMMGGIMPGGLMAEVDGGIVAEKEFKAFADKAMLEAIRAGRAAGRSDAELALAWSTYLPQSFEKAGDEYMAYIKVRNQKEEKRYQAYAKERDIFTAPDLYARAALGDRVYRILVAKIGVEKVHAAADRLRTLEHYRGSRDFGRPLMIERNNDGYRQISAEYKDQMAETRRVMASHIHDHSTRFWFQVLTGADMGQVVNKAREELRKEREKQQAERLMIPRSPQADSGEVAHNVGAGPADENAMNFVMRCYIDAKGGEMDAQTAKVVYQNMAVIFGDTRVNKVAMDVKRVLTEGESLAEVPDAISGFEHPLYVIYDALLKRAGNHQVLTFAATRDVRNPQTNQIEVVQTREVKLIFEKAWEAVNEVDRQQFRKNDALYLLTKQPRRFEDTATRDERAAFQVVFDADPKLGYFMQDGQKVLKLQEVR